MNKITAAKLDDLETINEKTGKSLSIMDLPISGSDINDSTTNDNSIAPMAALPGNGYTDDNTGKLYYVQQVIYLGTSDSKYRYLYNTNAEWYVKPLNTKTDIIGVAWDEKAVAQANTFKGTHYNTIETGVGWLEETKNLSLKDPKAYGYYVEFPLGEGSFQNINTQREVRVHTSYKNHPAYIVSKYFHKYYSIVGTSVSISPVSVNIPDSWLANGDLVEVEYSYDYGDN